MWLIYISIVIIFLYERIYIETKLLKPFIENYFIKMSYLKL